MPCLFYVKFYFSNVKVNHALDENVQYSLCQRRTALVFFPETTSADLKNFSGVPLQTWSQCCVKPWESQWNAFYGEILITLHLRSNRKPHVSNQDSFIFMWLRRNTRCVLHKFAAPVSWVTCWQMNMTSPQTPIRIYDSLKEYVWSIILPSQSEGKPQPWSALHRERAGASVLPQGKRQIPSPRPVLPPALNSFSDSPT